MSIYSLTKETLVACCSDLRPSDLQVFRQVCKLLNQNLTNEDLLQAGNENLLQDLFPRIVTPPGMNLLDHLRQNCVLSEKGLEKRLVTFLKTMPMGRVGEMEIDFVDYPSLKFTFEFTHGKCCPGMEKIVKKYLFIGKMSEMKIDGPEGYTGSTYVPGNTCCYRDFCCAEIKLGFNISGGRPEESCLKKINEKFGSIMQKHTSKRHTSCGFNAFYWTSAAAVGVASVILQTYFG